MPVLRNSITGGIGGRRGGVDAPNYSADTGAGMIGSAIHSMANAYGDGIKARARVDQFKIDQQAKRSKEVREAIEYFGESAVRMGKELDKSADRQAETDSDEEYIRYAQYWADKDQEIVNTPISRVNDEKEGKTIYTGPVQAFMKAKEDWDVSHLSRRAQEKFYKKRQKMDMDLYKNFSDKQLATTKAHEKQVFETTLAIDKGRAQNLFDSMDPAALDEVASITMRQTLRDMRNSGYGDPKTTDTAEGGQDPSNPPKKAIRYGDDEVDQIYSTTYSKRYAENMTSLVQGMLDKIATDKSDPSAEGTDLVRMKGFVQSIVDAKGVYKDASGVEQNLLNPVFTENLQKALDDTLKAQKANYDTWQSEKATAITGKIMTLQQGHHLGGDFGIGKWSAPKEEIEKIIKEDTELSDASIVKISKDADEIADSLGYMSFFGALLPQYVSPNMSDREVGKTYIEDVKENRPGIYKMFCTNVTGDPEKEPDDTQIMNYIMDLSRRAQIATALKEGKMLPVRGGAMTGTVSDIEMHTTDSLFNAVTTMQGLGSYKDRVHAIMRVLGRKKCSPQVAEETIARLGTKQYTDLPLEPMLSVLKRNGFYDMHKQLEIKDGVIQRDAETLLPKFIGDNSGNARFFFPTKDPQLTHEICLSRSYSDNLLKTLYNVQRMAAENGWSDLERDKYLIQVAEATMRDDDNKITAAEASRRLQSFSSLVDATETYYDNVRRSWFKGETYDVLKSDAAQTLGFSGIRSNLYPIRMYDSEGKPFTVGDYSELENAARERQSNAVRSRRLQETRQKTK